MAIYDKFLGHSYDMALASMRITRKNLLGTNTLAHFAPPSLMKKKSCYNESRHHRQRQKHCPGTLGIDVMKRLSSSRLNKLDRLSVTIISASGLTHLLDLAGASQHQTL
jgi:hypothetical protein